VNMGSERCRVIPAPVAVPLENVEGPDVSPGSALNV